MPAPHRTLSDPASERRRTAARPRAARSTRAAAAALALVVAVLWAPAAVGQATRTQLGYQGRLLAGDGTRAPAVGPVDLVFRIYGAGGSLLWTESWPATELVEGLFALQLGTTVPLVAALFAGHSALFLELEVDGEALSPRQQLGTVPFAVEDQPANERQTLGRAGTTLSIRADPDTADPIDVLAPQKLEPAARLSGPTHPDYESVAMRNRLLDGTDVQNRADVLAHGVAAGGVSSEDLVVRNPGADAALTLSPSVAGQGVDPELVIQAVVAGDDTDAPFQIARNARSTGGVNTWNEPSLPASRLLFAADGSIGFDTAAPDSGSGMLTWDRQLTLDAAGMTADAFFCDECIDSADIADGSLATDDVAAGAVTSAKIAAASLDGSVIQSGAIRAFKIVDGSVTNAHLADNAVLDAKLAANAVGTSQLAADAVTRTRIQSDSIGSSALAQRWSVMVRCKGTACSSATLREVCDTADVGSRPIMVHSPRQKDIESNPGVTDCGSERCWSQRIDDTDNVANYCRAGTGDRHDCVVICLEQGAG